LVRYRKATNQARASYRWRRYSLIGACVAGIVWGAAGYFLFIPASLPHQLFLAFVLGGMVAGAIPLLSILGQAYACFAIPVLLPISFQMLSIGDAAHISMGLMMLIFGLAMLAASAELRRFFQESIDLRLKLSSAIEVGESLEHLLRIDTLTGIPNRRLFEEMLDKEWRRAKREGTVLSLVTADIDYFKSYNDHYGHPSGDTCLREVAQGMAGVLRRPGDIAARTGGEEFAFLLPDTALDGAIQVGERIRRRIWELDVRHDAATVLGRVTVSLGVASSRDAGVLSTDDLVRSADRALYLAKRHGRNQLATVGSENEVRPTVGGARAHEARIDAGTAQSSSAR
ncbi:MAG: diguanylate cyclase, partial [Thiohalocapsa sp.]